METITMKDLHSLSNNWSTPINLFKQLNKEFCFTHDLCSNENNCLCLNRFEDYLTSVFTEGAGFCNPPYSNPKPFIEKAWEDSKHCKIVCLVKCDPSTKWWATFWNYKDMYDGYHAYPTQPAGPKPGCEVRFFPKRIKFEPPKGFEGKTSGPSFASALVIMDRRGIK